MMHVHDLWLIISDELRKSLHSPRRWRRETESQSSLEDM